MPPSEHLKLNVCDCGHLHLTYRSVTFHFEKEEFLHYAVQVGRMATRVSNTVGFGQTGTLATTKRTNGH